LVNGDFSQEEDLNTSREGWYSGGGRSEYMAIEDSVAKIENEYRGSFFQVDVAQAVVINSCCIWNRGGSSRRYRMPLSAAGNGWIYVLGLG